MTPRRGAIEIQFMYSDHVRKIELTSAAISDGDGAIVASIISKTVIYFMIHVSILGIARCNGR